MISKGTTPTFTLTFPANSGVDLTQAANVYVSFSGAKRFDKTGNALTVSERSVEVYLSQEETLSLAEGVTQIQVNWTYGDGSRYASDIVKCQIGDNLIERVIE